MPMPNASVHRVPCSSCTSAQARIADALRRADRDFRSTQIQLNRHVANGARADVIETARQALVDATTAKAVLDEIAAVRLPGCGLWQYVSPAEKAQQQIEAAQQRAYHAPRRCTGA